MLKYRIFAGNLRSVDEFTEFIDTLSAATQRALNLSAPGASMRRWRASSWGGRSGRTAT